MVSLGSFSRSTSQHRNPRIEIGADDLTKNQSPVPISRSENVREREPGMRQSLGEVHSASRDALLTVSCFSNQPLDIDETYRLPSPRLLCF